MIQTCSACGTRWNVRDRRREWCPRCNGRLLPPDAVPPAASQQWAPPGRAAGATRPGLGSAPSGRRLPPGFRWVAVRPGAPPPPPPRRRPLGPTPRYEVIPRWGLVDRFDQDESQREAAPAGPSSGFVTSVLLGTQIILGVAALLHLLRYVLLIINRTTLLPYWLAWAATWFGVVASVLAMFAVVGLVLVLTDWLIARRAAAFAHHGQPDPRGVWALRAGCLIPLVNLLWAPVFVIELARLEQRTELRRPIVAWWMVWVASTVVSIFSIATSFATDAQGIGNNTLTTTIAYLVALAAVLLVMKIYRGFERQPVTRPSRRWVVVAERPGRPDQPPPDQPRPDGPGRDDAASPAEPGNPDHAAAPAAASADAPGGAVENTGQNPAA
ncbi:hypothetical protein MHAS_04469 [Mycolicibacterium hassiacum DSM 44199]|nr:DUF4328 domain-containing protein [Mycolicibacterium hassiacum]MDA4085393.1 membrane protein [Mycolicibacterium hassiacum DSM 44199]VCT92739.1 hypothetical protein MHAS_04469 [Mycolicibacterium hassiacum DSM 44199]